MNKNIDGQQIDKITRQSEGYYIYLANNAKIRVLNHFGVIYFIPAITTGDIEKIKAKNCMDAIRQYIEIHNLKN